MGEFSMKDIIIELSSLIAVYYPSGYSKINGKDTIAYATSNILGAFLPNGKSRVKTDSFNKIESTYDMYSTSDALLNVDCTIKYNNNYYKIKEQEDWEQWGEYRKYSCELASIEENRDLKEFINGLPTNVL